MNQKKHKIVFDDAKDVFNDKSRIQYIVKRKKETRYITIGKAFQALITVVYTVRNLAIRIISARRSNREERKDYISNKLSKSLGEDE